MTIIKLGVALCLIGAPDECHMVEVATPFRELHQCYMAAPQIVAEMMRDYPRHRPGAFACVETDTTEKEA